MIVLTVFGVSKDALADGHSVGTVLKYNAQTKEFSNQFSACYDNGKAWLGVTVPFNEKIKDASKTLVEFTMATKASEAKNPIARYLLPKTAYIAAQGDGSEVGVGAQWAAPKVGSESLEYPATCG